jgi:hypothetical protein
VSRLTRWPKAILIAVDQLANAVAMGSEDDTISSRAWKAKVRGKGWGKAGVAIIDALFLYIDGPNHCERSAEWDER